MLTYVYVSISSVCKLGVMILLSLFCCCLSGNWLTGEGTLLFHYEKYRHVLDL